MQSKLDIRKTSVLARAISLSQDSCPKKIVGKVASNDRQTSLFCNVHMLMLSQEDKTLADAMDGADWVFADSAPVAWLQRRISGKDAKVIPGYKIMLAIFERAVKSGEKVGFIGSTPQVMSHLVSNLHQRFEGLQISYEYCPPFMEGQLVSTKEEIEAINESGINWLFVGLGCPKQEKWIATYRHELNCHVLGVGAAFEWLSGLVPKPPDWMERFGVAWLFRLFNNPSKMWSRYLIYNSKFVVRVAKLLVTGK